MSDQAARPVRFASAWRRLRVTAWLTAAAACGGGTAEQRPVETAPAADPRAAKLYLDAVQQMAAGDPESQQRAISGFEGALQADSSLWEAHYNLGVLLWRRGELRQALPHLEEAHELAEAEREPLLALAEAQHALGKRAEAARLLAEYVEAHPDAIDVRIALAAVLRERGAYDEALASARQALVRDPANLAALLEVGRIYRVKGDFDVAEVVFEKALALDAKSASAHNDLGLLALARGDTQRAFDEFEKATASDARFVPARLNRASVLLRAGDYAAAQREYRAVLEVAADSVEARVALGICLRGLREPALAEAEYEKALKTAPNHAAALFDLAILRADFQDRRADAVPLFERYLEVAASDDPARQTAERYLEDIRRSETNAAESGSDPQPESSATPGTNPPKPGGPR